ncbi:MAG: thioesterase domain-containing protein [Planctomycetaceae bacterium]
MRHRPIMHSRFGLLLLFALSSGCVAPPLSGCRPNVFVLEGIAGYWPGCCAFERTLRAEGIHPIMAFAEEYYPLAEFIADEKQSGRLEGPIVVMGYSLGANTAILLAERLQERGVDVDKLVLLECSYCDAIPSNVHECFNVYKSHPWTDWFPVFRGIPLEAESDQTQLVNYDLRVADPAAGGWHHHLIACANHHIHDIIVDEIWEGFGESPDGVDGGWQPDLCEPVCP